jgi:hypothetical protein
MRDTTRFLLKLELLFCFGPCTAMLMAGAAMSSHALIKGSEGSILFLLFVLCGAIGLWTLLLVVSALFFNKETIENPKRIVFGVLLGAAPLIYLVIDELSSGGEVQWGLFTAVVVLPLLSTAHILYLSRNLLTASFQRERGNEA